MLFRSVWQWVPIGLLALSLALVNTVRPMKILMWVFLASGLVGIGLHNKAKMEFQLESDCSLTGWALFLKSFDSKNPPALAPGAMVQLALIGLAYQAARKART